MKIALLVEDDVGIAEMLIASLKTQDFEVMHVDTAGRAIHQFLQYRDEISIIICDGRLKESEATSVDFIKIVDGLGFEGPIIAISGEDDMNRKLMAAGCTMQVPKPINLPRFIQSIRS